MAKSPAFQFYPKDWLSDELVRRMSHTEKGIYIDLLSVCWVEQSLPADTEHLAQIIGMTPQRFLKLWTHSVLQQCFFVNGDGRLHHKRLDAERQKQENYRRRQSDNGSKGGRPKKGE